MSKFQSRLVKISCFFKRHEDGAAVFCLLIPCIVAVMFFVGPLLFNKVVIPLFSALPMFILFFVWAASEVIYDRACEVFDNEFGFQPSCDQPSSTSESEVMLTLRKLALDLGEAYTKSYAGEDKIKEIKQRFWRAWLLAKTFGFPVFKSWKTHAKIKF